MIEAATASSYERALHSQVAAPFGLSHTTLPSDAKLPRPFVRGCQRDATGVPEDVSGLLPPAGRGLRAAWFLHRKRQTSSCAVTSPAERSIRRHTPSSSNSSRAAARTRPAPVTTRPGSPSSATRRAAAPSTVIQGAGYTQFVSATADGERSATVSINAQLGLGREHNPVRFAELRQLYELAVCAALD
jgi:CubicO group peptidase (beta-lactamase class C family)